MITDNINKNKARNASRTISRIFRLIDEDGKYSRGNLTSHLFNEGGAGKDTAFFLLSELVSNRKSPAITTLSEAEDAIYNWEQVKSRKVKDVFTLLGKAQDILYNRLTR